MNFDLTSIDSAAAALAKACAATVAKTFRDAGYPAAIVVVAVTEVERSIALGKWTELEGGTQP